jgi:hypothetical protein
VTSRVFLLSPASLTGERAQLVFNDRARFDLARALRAPAGAALGEVFSFLSGLYFRGKLRYAMRFARPPASVPGVLVITPADGLVLPESRVTVDVLRRWAEARIDLDDERYTRALRRDAELLTTALSADPGCEVVLLGSIASGKYVDLLDGLLGDRLRFPKDFVGRGDMSRGGLLLRRVDEGLELDYVPLAGAVRRGPRPARLVPRKRTAPPATRPGG